MSVRLVSISYTASLSYWLIPFFIVCVLIFSAITTVGYGDLTPRSFVGRLLTVPLLVFGLLLIALPSFVLGREFSALWDAHSRHHASTDGDDLGLEGDRHGVDLVSTAILMSFPKLTDRVE